MMKLSLLCLVPVSLFLIGTSSAQTEVPLAPPKAETVSPTYRLAPGDLVYIKVFQEDDLSSSYRVGEDGTINFPLIGSVHLGGLTVPEATKVLFKPLNEHYLVNPQISLMVLSYTEKMFTVLGQVERAGTYNLKEQSNITLLQALGMAGGLTRLADGDHVKIRRVVEGKPVVFRVNANKIAKESSETDITILPGDTITVDERIF